MLILRIRFVYMEYCAFILMGSLPIAWIAVGALLFILLLMMSVLWALKSREVATLKKQCEDLRETIRMMRYEEVSLSRMLHTASKPSLQKEAPTLVEETTKGEVEQVAPLAVAVAEVVVVDSSEQEEPESVAENSECAEEPTESFTSDDNFEEQEEVEVLPVANEDSEELEMVDDESNSNMSLKEQEDVEANLLEESEENVVVVEENQPSLPQSHKHPINERQPAIPTDLFAAWFAENEVSAEKEPAAQTDHSEANVAEGVVESDALTYSEDVSEEETSDTLVEEQVAESSSEVVVTEDEEEDAEVLPIAQDAAFATELSKEDERFCRKLERIVNTRLRNPNLNIDIIAAQFGIGRTNFYRKVRELTGMSPNDYLRKCRMERAAELLRTSEQPISEVCAQVGIPDAQYFSRVFKAYYGTAPSAYREQ